MKAIPLLSILFFVLQLYFCLWGRENFDIFENPIGFFLAYVGLAVCYFVSICRTDFTSFPQTKRNPLFKFGAIGLSLLFFTFCVSELQNLFARIPEKEIIHISDVLPLIIEQFGYFAHGKTPYQPIALSTHTAYPAYMPFHWLPIGIARFLGIDPRWSGVFLLFLAILVFVFLSVSKRKNLIFNLLVILTPLSILYVFARWGDADLAITFETVIAAYYFLLAIGLMQKNLVMVIVGIILCLLSRYTLVFWLPMFFILLYLNIGFRKTAMSLAVIVLMLCLVFIFPFFLKDPTIIFKSLEYHNNAAIAEWKGGAYSFFSGVYFGPHINSLVEGTPEHKVFVGRVIQAVSMLLLMFFGLYFYKRNRHRASFYDISLGMLFLVVVCYYMIGPFAFRYYMLGPLYLSVVLLARVLLSEKRNVPFDKLN